MNDDLLALASTEDERKFATEAVEFLAGATTRRPTAEVSWGAGEEGLALFHETTDVQERAEADAARAWQRKRWDAGFGWLTGPREHGGRGLPVAFDRLYRRIEAEFVVPDMGALRIGLGWVSPTIVRYGSDEQLTRYAGGLHRGALTACALLSEPDAGSDLASVRTRGERDGTGWRLTGQKIWTSNGRFAGIGLALIRTDPTAPKHRGLTTFLVPMKQPGVEVRPIRQLTGGTSFCEVFLDGAQVPDSLRLGEEGNGWRVATSALANERRDASDRSHDLLARAQRLLGILADRAGRADDPLVRDSLAQLYIRLRVARLHQLRTQATASQPITQTSGTIDKLLVAANLREIGELAAELLGPAFAADTGEWGTFGWTKWMLGALGYRIAGGTEEVLKTMLAERVLGLPREG